jgi:putative ABC transport system permease protein
MTIETQNETPSLAELRTYPTSRCRAGLRGTPAPGVPAMTLGLVRSETARDLRTLTATGASSRDKLARQTQNWTICAMARRIGRAIEAAQTRR